jgi:hypothetical protein
MSSQLQLSDPVGYLLKAQHNVKWYNTRRLQPGVRRAKLTTCTFEGSRILDERQDNFAIAVD